MVKAPRLLSPAKVNIRLDVLGKRKDGYHEIESIMARIDLYDEVSIYIEDGDGVTVVCSNPNLSGEGNIAYKAALEILKRCHKRNAVKIEIEKNIPVAAGLGGGSSNAATVLMGLNNIFDAGLSKEELMRIGASIGADVPFFILERSAIARGIGEVLEPIELPPIWFLLANPNIPVSTGDIYRGLNLKIGLTRESFGINISNFKKGVRGIAPLLHNDLEDVALNIHPEIRTVKEEILSTKTVGALMSGSGATVFGLYESREDAKDAFDDLSSRHDDWHMFVVKNI